MPGPGKKLILRVAAALLLVLALLAAYVFLIEPNRLVMKEETIELAGWPAGFENLKVAVVSDLHVGSPFINEEKLDYITLLVNGAQPDMVVLLGDFMSSVRGGRVVEPEVIAAHLKNLRARLGVFAVLGNHDWWYNGQRVRRALENAGIRVLDDEVARVERNGQAIWLVGFKDAWTNRTDIEGVLRKVTDNSPIVGLTHNPDLFVRIPQNVLLTLAGHTHGGQVNLPFFGRIRVPSEYGQRYAAGHVLENNHHLYVTTGIGTSIIPIRFRVPPEIVILTLKTSAPEGAK
ncbi:MAG TPA: metallophosphoesterase [Pyrinomonadaceae bacterium]|nr:metallophosphoesterase [Pyrinomonadaceae bacterium]